MQSSLGQAKVQVALQQQVMTHRLQALERAIQEEGGVTVINYETRRHLQDKLLCLTQAQSRIQAGTYGLCTECGQPIEAERMEIVPDTTLCAACVQSALRTHTQTTASRNRSPRKQ